MSRDNEYLNGVCPTCDRLMCGTCGRCGPLGAVVIHHRPPEIGPVAYCNIWCAWEQRFEIGDLELMTSDYQPCDNRPSCPRCNGWGWVVPAGGAEWYCRPCEAGFAIGDHP